MLTVAWTRNDVGAKGEFLMAAAGPIMSFELAIVVMLIPASGSVSNGEAALSAQAVVLLYLAGINCILASILCQPFRSTAVACSGRGSGRGRAIFCGRRALRHEQVGVWLSSHGHRLGRPCDLKRDRRHLVVHTWTVCSTGGQFAPRASRASIDSRRDPRFRCDAP